MEVEEAHRPIEAQGTGVEQEDSSNKANPVEYGSEDGSEDGFIENNMQETNEDRKSVPLVGHPAQGDGNMVDIDLNQPSDSEVSENSSSAFSLDVSKDNTSSTNSSPAKMTTSDASHQDSLNSFSEQTSDQVETDPQSEDSENETVSSASVSTPSCETEVLNEESNLTDPSIQPHIQAGISIQDSATNGSSTHSNSVIKDCGNVADISACEQSAVQHSETSGKNGQLQSSEESLTCDSPQNRLTSPKSEGTRDDNDALLSELDAELEISESPIENDLADLPNGMRRRKISLSDIPEYKELKSRYESLQNHLEQQIIDTQR